MKLKTWRVDHDMTQAQMAAKLGLSASRLSRIESGEAWPNPVELVKIRKLTTESVGEPPAVDIEDLIEAWRAAHPAAVESLAMGDAAG